MKRYRIAILISGRGSNMEAIIHNVKNGELGGYCSVVIVVSNIAEAPGLGIARREGISTAVIESRGRTRVEFENNLLELLGNNEIDYIVLAGFNRIISPLLIGKYPRAIINIHPADTSRYKGLHGYEWAFENRLPATKITVHYVDEGVDTGEIIMQEEVDLRGAKSLEDVVNRGLPVEHRCYSKALIKVFSRSI